MALLEKPIARRYARALIALAEEHKALQQVSADLDAVAALIHGNAELRHALFSPSFKAEQRRALLNAVADLNPAGAPMHKLTRVLLNLFVDKRRVPYLPLVAEAFRSEADRLLGRVRADVQSAVPLQDGEIKDVTTALTAQARARGLGQEVVVTASVDPALLGGVRARLGGLVFDGSLRSHLRRMAAGLTV